MKAFNLTVLKSMFYVSSSIEENIKNDSFSDESSFQYKQSSCEKIKNCAKSQASNIWTKKNSSEKLLARLINTEKTLLETLSLMNSAVKTNHLVDPIGKWLLDNYCYIKDLINSLKKNRPKNSFNELPCMDNGPLSGLPRIYGIALEFILHSGGLIDPESFSSFIANATNQKTELKLGELRTIPDMLRLALIENIRCIEDRASAARRDRYIADSWADQMIEAAQNGTKSLVVVLSALARSNPPLSGPFAAQFVRRMRGHVPSIALPLAWIEQWAFESNLVIDYLIQSENRQQNADLIFLENCTRSFQLPATMDWQDIVIKLSPVNKIIGTDPSGDYPGMDFATRDQYLQAVEKIARKSHSSEEEIARCAIRLAKKSADSNKSDRSAHVGYYLVGKGLSILEGLVIERLSIADAIFRIIRRFSLALYMGSIILITVILSCSLLVITHLYMINGWFFALICILLFFSTSHIAIEVTNCLMTLFKKKHRLPSMDFSEGIPQRFRTLAVIPGIIANKQSIENMVEALELRFLTNCDDNLLFGLLTDFSDASEETLPGDESMMLLASKKIEELNVKYQGARGDTFFLFHRPRLWNPHERIWMGNGHNRGKLADLNSLLRGGSMEQFSLVVGEMSSLSGIQYVVTLDTDTELPRNMARQLVGAMAHPLNRPAYDKTSMRITDGYGFLLPNVGACLPENNPSIYAKLFRNDSIIERNNDHHNRSSSDFHKNVVLEGFCTGKGIYDVDALGQVLEARFTEDNPCNDLADFSYLRQELLSDVLVYENYAGCYCADASLRYHRLKTYWQMAGSLMSRSLMIWGLPFLSKWKIIDNIRLSLIPIVLTLILLFSWFFLSEVWIWTLSVVGILLAPAIFESFIKICQKAHKMNMVQHISASARSSGYKVGQALFKLICLPYEAFISLDVITLSIWKLIVKNKRQLKCNSSSCEDTPANLLIFCRTMWFAPYLSSAVIIQLALLKPTSLAYALPILSLWFVSPVIAWWISQPQSNTEAHLNATQILFLRKISRKTWAFFETFVGPENNWLPPDNCRTGQKNQADTIDNQASPTNMGLSLLANLSAYDFGYIPVGQLVNRTSNAIKTMESLERYQGHFYNLYDTKSLKPLEPLTISTVESGNLSAHMLLLSSGLRTLPDYKIINPRLFEGLNDTLWVLLEVAEGKILPALKIFQNDLAYAKESKPTLLMALLWLERLTTTAEDIACHPDCAEGEMKWWASCMTLQCRSALEELNLLAPWASLPSASDRLSDFRSIEIIPTLSEIALLDKELMPAITRAQAVFMTPEESIWLSKLRKNITEASTRARDKIAEIENLAGQLSKMAQVEYDFLNDKARHRLATGYNVSEGLPDSGFHSLLTSEARLAVFVAISQKKLPREFWFALGQPQKKKKDDLHPLSSKSHIFEGLIPLLVMPSYENSLIDRVCKSVVERQIDYGMLHNIPWGISESGLNMVGFNSNQNIAPSESGPDSKSVVIEPCASALALMVAPGKACLNLQRLAFKGCVGKYGFFKALDYALSCQADMRSNIVDQSFMANKQGMSFLAIAHCLLDQRMQKRFESEPVFKASILLLQERASNSGKLYLHTHKIRDLRRKPNPKDASVRIFSDPDTPIPEVQLLSNRRYHVMVTNSGGGYSRWNDIAVTRWREDSARDNWGAFCYICDLKNGEFWSNTYQPALKRPEFYEAAFSEGRAEFRRRDNDLEMHTEIAVSPEDDIELRRIRITNLSCVNRSIEATSYAEVVLSSSEKFEENTHSKHLPLSGFYVRTEILRQQKAILCTLRPCDKDESVPWMFHLMAVRGVQIAGASYETDRLQFVGRGNTQLMPRALMESSNLSGRDGFVLGPIVAIRNRIILAPGKSGMIDMVLGIGESRGTALGLIEKYQDRRLSDRVFDLAITHSQAVLQQLKIKESEAQLYGRLAGSLIHANSLPNKEHALFSKKNNCRQFGLRGYSISGGLPIVLLQIKKPSNIELVRQLVQARAYWRINGLIVDLIIWNEAHPKHRQFLHDQIMGLIASGNEIKMTDCPGGIFLRISSQISNEDRVFFRKMAQAIINDSGGSLEEQLCRCDVFKEASSAVL